MWLLQALLEQYLPRSGACDEEKEFGIFILNLGKLSIFLRHFCNCGFCAGFIGVIREIKNIWLGIASQYIYTFNLNKP